MIQSILYFSDPGTTLALAGGKGANLAKLARAGFSVPPGFIIATNAYRAFVETNHIQPRLLAVTTALSSESPTELENASADIRVLFEQGRLAGEIADSISQAYLGLAHRAVAVRSSATAEDLPGMAFAGQQDTYLNVVGADAVLEAVRRCWGSLWTARAMAYRIRNHIPPDQVTLAVVVQAMIPSEVSGVLFTANPVTGRRDEMVIDASYGLGEAIVSGQVEPDHYVVDPHTWAIRERQLGAKQLAILPRANGGTEHVEREGAMRQALPDTPILALAQMAQRVAEHFGAPQDIEWAWANQQLYLLQSRPITSLYPLPETVGHDDGLRVYVNFNSIQGVTDPLTPVGIDAIRLVFSHVPKLLHARSTIRQLLPDAGGRLFMDWTDLVRDPRLCKIAPNLLADTDPGARHILVDLIAHRPLAPKRVLTFRRMLTLILGLLPILRRVIGAMVAPDPVYARVVATGEQFIALAQARADSARDLSSRLRAMRDDLSHFEEIFLPVMPMVLPILSAIPLLDRWLVHWLGEKPGTAFQLVRGVPNLTTQMDLKLWAAAQAIRADPIAREAMQSQSVEKLAAAYRRGELPAVAQRALGEFLEAYGMRAATEIDMGRPRWREDPAPILHTLVSYLQITDQNQAPALVFRRNQERADALTAEYIGRAHETRWGGLRARLIGSLVHRIRALGGLREVPLFYMVRTLDIYRTVLLDSGRELAARGQLEYAQDIFFVPMDVLTAFAQGDASIGLKPMVAANRVDYERECSRKQMPRILLSNGKAFYEGASDTAAAGPELAGEAVSPGVVEGPVHVILDPHQAHLTPGEILVCPSTDPGWTPLFLAAGGLVMEIGGMITHGSIVAREYGVPAVVGIHHATTRLKDGDRVRVDGNRGVVTRIH